MAANIGGYISIGTNDLEAAREFYDKIFEPMGIKSFRGNDRSYFYRFEKTDTYFAIFVPFDGKEATVGNGSMTGITFDSSEEVDQIYQIAIESGAIDEGKPEQKMATFYGGYVRDLDGNKLVFCKMG
ncbi:MAG: VOC family protein [Gammaproteobacteria bacterium]|jgi:catechol 2,3-dioxygenase-like lactoylglutathione lyase family enzyme